MPSVLAVTGPLVDRAFPLLEKDAATRRRALTMSAMVRIAILAREYSVDAIVIVGGLFDEKSVGVQSLPAAMSVLESFEGPILIAPGTADPYTAGGVYAATRWGERVRVWNSSDFASSLSVDSLDIVGRASTSAWGSVPQLPQDGDSPLTVLVGDGLDPNACAAWVSERPGRHIITSGRPDSSTPGVTLLARINSDVGEPFGQAALIEMDADGPACERRLDVIAGTPGTFELDVSGIQDSDALGALVSRAFHAAEPWSIVTLVGTLRQGVLLPSTVGFEPPKTDVLLEEDRLEFEFVRPNSADRTAHAEFLRSIVDESGDDRQRHQAIALGLTALRATTRERVAL